MDQSRYDASVKVTSVPVDRADEVRELWLELARHHWNCAPPIAALAVPVDEEFSWATRRAQYQAWGSEPGWLMLGAVLDKLAGHAAARIGSADSSWRFGPHVGRLETLVLAEHARGRGTGEALVDRVRADWSTHDVRYGWVSAIAGNVGAERFYQRLGAVEFTRTSYLAV